MKALYLAAALAAAALSCAVTAAAMKFLLEGNGSAFAVAGLALGLAALTLSFLNSAERAK